MVSEPLPWYNLLHDSRSVLLQDGPGDSDEDADGEAGEEDEDVEGATNGGSGSVFRAPDEGDDPLAGLSSDSEGEGGDIANIILCQFDKVSIPSIQFRHFLSLPKALPLLRSHLTSRRHTILCRAQSQK